MKKTTLLSLAAAGFLTASASAYACWEEAAELYHVPAQILYAIAQTESRLNPRAMNRNADGTYDIGIMQINSSWQPKLSRYGISRHDLLDACTNIKVGAWILANNIARFGYNWRAIGAYNASSEKKRMVYVQKVYRELTHIPGQPQAQAQVRAQTPSMTE